MKEQISERHARSLLNIPDAKKQKEMLKKIINNKMSVRNLEEEIKQEYPKAPTEEPININPMPISMEQNFVNNSPLMPTTDLSTPQDNYGKVTIAPPDEDMHEETPQFINYGEVNSEEETTAASPTQLNLDSSVAQVNVSDIKENANDLNIDQTQVGGLDSLLNIKSNATGHSISGDDFKFLTPAEGIVKAETENTESEGEGGGDYFKPTDNDAFTEMIPDNFVTNIENEKYTIEVATKKIRDLVEDLKNHGIELTTDEMNFEKSYQIIIKINK